VLLKQTVIISNNQSVWSQFYYYCNQSNQLSTGYTNFILEVTWTENWNHWYLLIFWYPLVVAEMWAFTK